MEDTSRKELPGGFRVLVVTPCANIPDEYDFADLLAIALDIDNGTLGYFGLDHSDW